MQRRCCDITNTRLLPAEGGFAHSLASPLSPALRNAIRHARYDVKPTTLSPHGRPTRASKVRAGFPHKTTTSEKKKKVRRRLQCWAAATNGGRSHYTDLAGRTHPLSELRRNEKERDPGTHFFFPIQGQQPPLTNEPNATTKTINAARLLRSSTAGVCTGTRRCFSRLTRSSFAISIGN